MDKKIDKTTIKQKDVEKNTSSDLSDNDDLVEPWENLIQYLTANHLEKLCKIFHKIDQETLLKEPIQMTKEKFIDSIDAVIGNSYFSYQALSLFKEIPYPESEKITWLQFMKFYMDYVSVEEHRSITLSIDDILTVPHIKIDSIMKIVLMETPTSFSYAIISKYGKVGVYDGNINLLCSYDVIFSRTDVLKFIKPRHRKTTWITDAIFVPNLCTLIISTSARSLMFYDANNLKHKPLCLIEGIPYTIQCFTYSFNPELNLLLGNDQGCLITMKFLKEKNGLFRKKYTDKLNAYFWQELKNESEYIWLKKNKLHTTSIDSIVYCKDTNSTITCSRDRKWSIIFYNLKDNRNTYVFKIDQGASCFSVSHNLRTMITGSENGTVHLWNSVVISQPMAVFKQHKSSIIDVKILEFKRVAISLSNDGVLNVWNVIEQKCQQTLHINYPCFDVLGKGIEWGKLPIYPGPKRFRVEKPKTFDETISETKQNDDEDEEKWNRSDILIACCNYIAVVNINYETGVIIPKPDCLQPPALQNDIILPEDWKSKKQTDFEPEVESFDIELNEYVQKSLEEFDRLDILKNVRIEKFDINYRIATLEAKKEQMKLHVSKCAPYLALDLHEVEEPRLSENLPVPNDKNIQKIVDKTYKLLSEANFRSGILSDRSSRSRSSRSSILEF